MMQYDKRSASAKNRTKNFLAINKSLVSKNKSNYLPKINPDEQKRNKFGQQERSTRDKPKLPIAKAKGPSSHNNQQHNDTVTISRDYLEKLLKGATGAPSIPVVQAPSFPQPPAVPIPQQHLPYDHPMQQPSVPQQYNQGGIYDHSQVPGLLDQQPLQQYHDVARQPTGPMAASNFPGQDTNSYYSSDIMNTSCQESPRGGGTYHRGTTNRPLHPAMRSSVFGGGPGWGGDSHQTERDEAKKRWLNELDEQVKTQNTHTSPVSVGGGRPRKDSYPPQIPPSVGHQHHSSIRNPPNPVTAVPSQRDDVEVFQMKAHNVHNPTAVGGGASHVSVGLQQQMSPREYTEKKMKELEHRDYLLAQMEEKRRLKEEEKRAIEREAEIEERRMAMDRERIAREFEMEKEIQRRKKMEEANRIAHLEQRIKMAEKSAIAAKEGMKKSKKVTTTNQHNSNNNNKHVAFNNHSKRYPHSSNGSGYMNEDNIPPLNTDEMYLEGVKTSIDLRSPSLHTIPISASQSDKSVTSPRNSHDKRHGSKGTRSTQKTSMPSHHHHMAMASNSQVSLYSSSSEEPVNAVSKRRSKPKPEPPSSGKPKLGQRESRIPRRTILRKQLGKAVNQNKSESESDGNKASMGVSIATTGNRRTVAAGGHQLQQQQQMPNSVAKTRSSNRASSHKGPSYNRPSSNDSQENVRPSHKNRRLTKAHSVPQEREVLDPLPHSRSPPVPAVAKRLKEHQTGTTSPPVPAVTKRLKEQQTGTTSPPVPAVTKRLKKQTGTTSPPIPALTKSLKKELTGTTSPPVPAVTKRLKEKPTGTTSPPVPAVARCIEEGQFRTTSPPVPAVAKRIIEEKSNKLKQNGGLSANDVKRQDNVLPDISVTVHDTPQTRQTKMASSNQEFEFPRIAPAAQVQQRKSPPNSQSSVPSLPPVPRSGVINHQPHIGNGDSVVSHPLPPINQPQANNHRQSNGRRSTSKPTPSLPPLPQHTAATQAPLPPQQQQPPTQQQQYTVYSQNTIPSFDNNQSGVDPPTQSSVVQYVRAPSYPPDSDHVKPAVRRHHHHHREDRKALRNAVCVLPTIAEVRSQEEMKESISNKSLTCHASCHTANHKEVVEELLKLRQGIRSQMMSFHSRLSSVLPPER